MLREKLSRTALLLPAFSLLAISSNASGQTKPMQTWYNCLTKVAGELNVPTEPAGVVVDASFGECLSEQSAYRQDFNQQARNSGLNPADRDVQEVYSGKVEDVRKLVLAYVLKLRAAR